MFVEGWIEATGSRKYFVCMKALVPIRRKEQERGCSTNGRNKGE
jgi:hypothetical protein